MNPRSHTFSGLQNEGNAVPSFVLNICSHSAEGWAAGLLGHGVVLFVGGFASIEGSSILANDDIFRLDSINRAQNTHLVGNPFSM